MKSHLNPIMSWSIFKSHPSIDPHRRPRHFHSVLNKKRKPAAQNSETPNQSRVCKIERIENPQNNFAKLTISKEEEKEKKKEIERRERERDRERKIYIIHHSCLLVTTIIKQFFRFLKLIARNAAFPCPASAQLAKPKPQWEGGYATPKSSILDSLPRNTLQPRKESTTCWPACTRWTPNAAAWSRLSRAAPST